MQAKAFFFIPQFFFDPEKKAWIWWFSTLNLWDKSHPIIGYSTVYLKWIWVIYKKSSLKLLKNISTYLPTPSELHPHEDYRSFPTRCCFFAFNLKHPRNSADSQSIH